jgi:hypothetical protein
MDSGTWGEWVGAGATTLATIVALYFGTRDQALAEDRSAARLAIRTRARDQALQLVGYSVGINSSMSRDPDIGNLEDDTVTAAYIADARRLGVMRRTYVRRLVTAIYGKSLVTLADLDPGPHNTAGLRRLIIETDTEVRAFVAKELHDDNWAPRTSSQYHRALSGRRNYRRLRNVRRLLALLANT